MPLGQQMPYPGIQQQRPPMGMPPGGRPGQPGQPGMPGQPPPGMAGIAGGGQGGMAGQGWGRPDPNAQVGNQILAGGQRAAAGASMAPSGQAGISSASPGQAQQRAGGMGSALAGAFDRLSQDNLGAQKFNAAQQLGTQQLAGANRMDLMQLLSRMMSMPLQSYGLGG